MANETEKLFLAVQSNNHEEIKQLCAQDETDINAKSSNEATVLHIAAWKGYLESVQVILENKGDPNIIGRGQSTPLHYAANCGHFEVVKELLAHGAIYDLKTEEGGTPLSLCGHEEIIQLLKTIDDFFQLIAIADKKPPLVDELNRIGGEDMSIVKAVVNARNENHHTLIEAAIVADCMNVTDTLHLFTDQRFDTCIIEANKRIDCGKYRLGLRYLRENLKNRLNIFGPESPASLIVEKRICSVIVLEGKFKEALKKCSRIYEIEVRTLGENCMETIRSHFNQGSVLYKMERYQDALPILSNVCDKIAQIQGRDNANLPQIQHILGVANFALGYFEPALAAYTSAYEIEKSNNGADHFKTLEYLSCMGAAFCKLGQYDDAVKVLEEIVRHQEATLGPEHPRTIGILYDITFLYDIQCNTNMCEIYCKKVLELREKYLGSDHRDTLTAQHFLALTFKKNNKLAEAREVIDTCLERMIFVFGEDAAETIAATKLSYELHSIVN